MIEECPEKVRKCQTAREYEHFVEEFLTDIRATISTMEAVCPIAMKKSLRRCPVFRTINIYSAKFVQIKSLSKSKLKTIPVLTTDIKAVSNFTGKTALVENIQTAVDENKLENKILVTVENNDDEEILPSVTKPVSVNIKGNLNEERVVQKVEERESVFNLALNNSSRCNSSGETSKKSNEEENNCDIKDTFDVLLVTCQNYATGCLVTKLLLATAIVSLVLISVAFYVEVSPDRSTSK